MDERMIGIVLPANLFGRILQDLLDGTPNLIL